MKTFFTLCSLLLLACAAQAQTATKCQPLAGAEGLWARPNLRFVLVGEMHGTAETPQVFGDLVCAARAAKRPVLVGLERPSEEQKAIDRFLARNGHEEAVRELLREPDWDVLDGRSSQAMLGLLDELRALKLHGDIAGVVAFDDRRSGETPAQREERMAAKLTEEERSCSSRPQTGRGGDCLVVALTGNFHGSRKPSARLGGYPWMAMLLPANQWLSLLVTDKGGEAWTQNSDGCAPHPITPSGGDERGVVLGNAQAAQRGYDGVLATGLNTTASPPAIPDAPKAPACTK